MSYAVVGGGISGLAAAFYLRRLLPRAAVTVLEGSSRLGGWIQSSQFPQSRHDHGPRTVRPAGPQGANTLEMVQELGLADKVTPILSDHPAAKNRYVLVDGKLHKLPSSLGSLFRRLPPFSRPLALSALTDLSTPPKKCEDDSLYDFVARRFGEDVAKYAVDPMVRGVCAGDARQISAASFVAGPLFRMEQEDGGVFRSVIKGALGRKKKVEHSEAESCDLVKKARSERWSVWTLEGGLETLVSALEERLTKEEGVEIRKDSPVRELSSKDGPVLLSSGNDLGGSFDGVFLTCPAPTSASLLSGEASVALSSIPFVTVAVVTVEFDSDHLPGVPDAFGFLVPSSQPELILGVVFDTCSFPQPGKSVFTVMLGGQWFKELFSSSSPSDIESVAVRELKKALKLEMNPSRVVTKVQTDCIPQYRVGHAARVREARRALEGKRIWLSGCSYDGVGINDAIMSSRRQVEKIA